MKDHTPRILAGAFKGRALTVPRGRSTRPLRSLARGSLFDMLTPELPGTRFLDLFAGSGAVGFEALSRGAESIVLVDSGRPALEAMRRTAKAFSVTSQVKIVGGDALRYLLTQDARDGFDLLYLGPPYPLYRGGERDYLNELFDELAGVARPDGLVVIEYPDGSVAPRPVGLTAERERKYGESVLGFYRVS